MKNKYHLMIIMILTLLVVACSQEGIKDSDKYTRYFNNKKGYSILYPKNWVVRQGNYRKIKFLKTNSTSKDSVIEGDVNVLVAYGYERNLDNLD